MKDICYKYFNSRYISSANGKKRTTRDKGRNLY